MKTHGINLNEFAPMNNLDVFISIPTNHILTSKIRDLDIQLRGHKYNPQYNFTDNAKCSDVWVVITHLTNSPTTLHNIFYQVFHDVAQVNVYKAGIDSELYFEWVS